jgi:hypothetical protein
MDAFLSPADELPGDVLKAPKQGVPECRPLSPSHRGKMICFLFPDVSRSCHLQFQGLTLSQPDVRRHPRSEGEDCQAARAPWKSGSLSHHASVRVCLLFHCFSSPGFLWLFFSSGEFFESRKERCLAGKGAGWPLASLEDLAPESTVKRANSIRFPGAGNGLSKIGTKIERGQASGTEDF